MKKILSAAAGLLILTAPVTIASSSAALAQETTVVADPYRDLAFSLASDESMEQSFRLLIDQTMPKMFVDDENVAMLELVCPGTVDTMMEVIEPLMRPAQERGYAQYRSDLTALFAENLSIEDANQAAAFYDSELGRKFVTSIVGSTTLDRSLTSAMKDEDSSVGADDLAKDTREAALRGILGMKAEDRVELLKILSTAEWMKTYRTLAPQMGELQLKLANTDLNPKEKKAFDSQLGPALEAHMAACPAAAE